MVKVAVNAACRNVHLSACAKQKGRKPALYASGDVTRQRHPLLHHRYPLPGRFHHPLPRRCRR
ncbi:hypothetical protein D4N07_01485 [Enterobacter hormaechei]|nr:hypothetical protein D4N07_01485 [Enterobacter hormaechei]